MVVEIHTRQSPEGYRTYIVRGRKVHVIDGNMAADDIRTTRAVTPYLYGT